MAIPQTIRDDWSIHIRTDGGEPCIEVKSEHVFVGEDGVRHVVKGLPVLTSALKDVKDHPLKIGKHNTTVGATIAALREEMSRAVDQLESDRDQRSQVPLHEKLSRRKRD